MDKKFDKKEVKKNQEFVKVEHKIEKFQIRDLIDGKIILNIDGLSCIFSGKAPKEVFENKNMIGSYVNIKHCGKNDKTKQLKDAEILI